MGLLRLYLALCVVGAHSTHIFPWTIHRGHQAVQIFYIISGFYMAMVLSSGKYSETRHFYISRFLRIFPTTWVVTISIIIICILLGSITGHWHSLTPYLSEPFHKNGVAGVIIAALTNVTLFGQDWVMFLSDDHNSFLHITSNFRNDNYPLWRYLIIPQAWSIGVELTFYLIVPLINKQRTIVIVGIILLSMSIRVIAYNFFGFSHDPWSYRFFPFELATFCLGIIAYRFYEKYYIKISYQIPKDLFVYLIFSVTCIIIFYLFLRADSYGSRIVGSEYSSLISYPLWAALIANLFFLSRASKYDRFLGELSFPIYIVHYFIISMVRSFIHHEHIQNFWLGPVSACASIGVSIVLYKQFIKPLDRVRHFRMVGKHERQYLKSHDIAAQQITPPDRPASAYQRQLGG